MLLTIVSPLVYAADETNGFLVFDVERLNYTMGARKSIMTEQKFKVPLTKEFLSNFTNAGFYCGGGNLRKELGSTMFTWWLYQTSDNHWDINMWGKGFETLNGHKLNSWNPCSSDSLTIAKLEDLNMSYMLSYNTSNECLNVSFAAKYVASKDIKNKQEILMAPVQKADRTLLFKGDDLTNSPLQCRCAFQE